MQVKQGDQIPLSVQLFDGDTAKYVRATVRGSNGTPLAGSPVDLTHVGNGLYTDDSLVMPLDNFVTASYRVYTDAGYTIPSDLHSDTEDIFNLMVPVAELIEVLSKVNQILQELSGAADIIGELDDTGALEGQLADSDDLEGYVTDNGAITGELSDEGLLGSIESPEIVGEVKC